jgi:uridylate kinase
MEVMTLSGFKRVLVKLSGGAVAGENESGFAPDRLGFIADEILSLVNAGVEVAIVIGGGNIFRGNLGEQWGIDRVEADNIGTLATVINSLMLRGVLKSKTEHEIRVMTSIPIPSVAEPYIRLRASHHMEKGHIVIFGGGNGQPFVTTDYPSVQRAIEVDCDAIFVAKQGVDGVYDADPKRNSSARRYASLHYDDVLRENLGVMDQAAFILARDHHMPLYVFNFDEAGAMLKIAQGESVGTLISKDSVKSYFE